MRNKENFRNQIIFLAALLCLYRQQSSSEGILTVTIITGGIMMMGFALLFTKLPLTVWGIALSVLLLNAGTWIALSAYFPAFFYPEESLTVGMGSIFFCFTLLKSSDKRKLCAAFGCFLLSYGLLCSIPGWYVFRFFGGYLFLCAVFFFMTEAVSQKKDTGKAGGDTEQIAIGSFSLVKGLLAAALLVVTAEQILNSWW